MDFKPIIELIENNNFGEAENILENKLKLPDIENKDITRIEYLIGVINNDYKNKKASKSKAKRYFGYVIDREAPFEMAFYFYAQLEKDMNISKNVLRKGLSYFPQSEKIYEYLINISEQKEREIIFDEIHSKKIISYALLIKEIETFFTLNKYELVVIACDAVISFFELSEYETHFFKLILCFSILLSNNEERYFEAEQKLQKIIASDTKNILEYKHLLALAFYYYKIKDNINTYETINKIPAGYIIEDFFDGPWVLANIDFKNPFENFFAELMLLFKADKKFIAKVKCLRALYLFSPFKVFGELRFNSQHIRDLQSALKFYPDQYNIYDALYYIYIEKKDYLNAFTVFMKSLTQHFDDYEIDYESCIENSNEKDFEYTLLKFESIINQEDYINYSLMCKTILSSIIERLFKEKKYNKIIDIVSQIDSYYFRECDYIFEIAYSYKQEKATEKSKTWYLELINQKKASSAVYNNLGVIYEEAGDLFKAKDLYIKAVALDKKDETAKRNLKRVKEQELKKISANITFSKMKTIGFDDNLFLEISNFSNNEIADIIKRDIQENAIALSTGLYKLSMIMSGSIIEAILLNKLKDNGITEFKLENGNKRKIEELDLNQLISATEQNKLIKTEHYHFSNAIRQYRNLVHPGKEIRSMANSINEDNAMLMWDVLKKLIKEI